MALDKIKRGSGRLAQLEKGQGQNQPARASDVNPIIDYLNNRMGETAALNTTTAGNTPTINAVSGVITTASLTTAAGASTSITLTNSNITPNSIVVANITGYTGAGLPVITKVVPAAGSAVISLSNAHSATALNAAATIQFVIL